MNGHDPDRRLRAIAIISADILALGESNRDERTETEMRDILRLAQGDAPRTIVGKAAWVEAESPQRELGQ